MRGGKRGLKQDLVEEKWEEGLNCGTGGSKEDQQVQTEDDLNSKHTETEKEEVKMRFKSV